MSGLNFLIKHPKAKGKFPQKKSYLVSKYEEGQMEIIDYSQDGDVEALLLLLQLLGVKTKIIGRSPCG